MKKLLILSLIVAVLCQQSITLFAESANYDYYFQDFMVSAYYSPIPGQKNYMRGSYEEDIKLNGNGTNGADGTEVFPGMLAAPKTYSYGTVIEIPELGVGSVHDRGGAIIEKTDYHRIDVWMGKGDEGLNRAMNWGMRKVTGKVYFEKNAAPVSFNYGDISVAEPISFKNRKSTYTASSSNTVSVSPAFVPPVTKDLEPGQIDDQVIKLKEIMKELGFFEGETHNNYFDNDLSKALIIFQQEKNIITSASDYGAGHFGAKTRNSLNEILKNKKSSNSSIISTLSEAVEAFGKSLSLNGPVSENSEEEDIKLLQRILANFGYFNGSVTGVYNEATEAAVFAFQKDHNVVKETSEIGAGSFGPKTSAVLSNVLVQRKEKLTKYPQVKTIAFEGVNKELSVNNIKPTIKEKKSPNPEFTGMVKSMILQ